MKSPDPTSFFGPPATGPSPRPHPSSTEPELLASVLDVLDDGVLVLDRHDCLVQANAEASSLLGIGPEAIAAGAWRLPLAPAEDEAAASRLRTREAIRDVAVEIDLADGTRRTLGVDYLPLRRNGMHNGLVLTLRDASKDAGTPGHGSLQATLDAFPVHVAVLDAMGDIIATNHAWDAFAAANGAEPFSCRGNYFAACEAAGEDSHALHARAGLDAVMDGELDQFTLEYPCHGPDAERWFVLRAARYDGPGPACLVVAHDDVTESHHHADQLRIQAALLDDIDVGVVTTDLAQMVTYWNRGAESIYGWTREEVVGRPVPQALVPAGGLLQRITDGLDAVGHWEGEIDVVRRDGTTVPVELRSRVTVDADGLATGVISASVDVSERVASQRALEESRDQARAVADSMGQGLVTVDVDGCISYVNPTGEALLGWSQEALHGCPITDITAGPDGQGTDPAPGAHALSSPVRKGVTVRDDDATFVRQDGSTFAVSYTAAPFETATGVQGRVVLFEDVSERKAYEDNLRRDVEKLAWIGRVQAALAEDRFVLYAQPIIDLRTREVVQRELLLRMLEPDGRIVGPGNFLPVAEKYGLIGDIDRWVIEQATAIAATGGRVELNVSAQSVGDPAILEHIERCVRTSGADPSLIVFEITETALLEDEAAARVFAERIHALGSRLALDDFGTGYGTFTYLKHLPVDFLKIDIEFVRDLATNRASHHVVEAVVALSKAFGLQTIAEGVEDAATLELLVDLGVDFAQGYHIARPGPLEAGLHTHESRAA